jgi:hypothetical protein
LTDVQQYPTKKVRFTEVGANKLRKAQEVTKNHYEEKIPLTSQLRTTQNLHTTFQEFHDSGSNTKKSIYSPGVGKCHMM